MSRDVRMWFLQILGPGRSAGSRGRSADSHLNVLTPDNIPEFCIPPRRAASPGRRPGALQAARRHHIQVESAGPGPGEMEGQEVPMSGPGLVPLHANPSEIIYLPKSPHTRRKESLFHSPEAWPGAYLGPQGVNPGPWAHPGLHGPWALDSDTASSADSSPFSSPLPPRACGQRGFRPSEPPLSVPAKETALALDRGGTLRVEAEYRPEDGRLRLRLLTGQDLYPASFQARDVGCCVSLCLLPGKAQKQRSAIVRRSREPVFNEDFFFEGLSQDELSRRALRFKVLNRASGVRRDCVMGQCCLELFSVLPAAHALSRG
ncbi:C2 calcium-dependent domain-containing protein 4C-like [Pristis pectinata]|uniref:C2 calcium-dependent domain-containing protein 4C-like n=1 Tax=Pristis pectinata TaxID=685728 RepID=UPI00223CCF7B|nr:C2 calcium-dependent domain-containing protein 4C-like [Pristis pectinata]XP_051901869.1 C2 calcium-dependent domain-containing protein 4C-like [Pristis pectinata]